MEVLQLVIPGGEFINESTLEFVQLKDQIIKLEHSLLSVSKWEAIYKKPFLTKEQKTMSETIEYARCMTITQNVSPEAYLNLTSSDLKKVQDYISDSMTATTFSNREPPRPNREIITSEIIYYWMIEFGIPFECEKWHLNRLLALIQVCNIKRGGSKKMSQKDILAENRRLNASRLASAKSRK